jgi:hypothetical protein
LLLSAIRKNGGLACASLSTNKGGNLNDEDIELKLEDYFPKRDQKGRPVIGYETLDKVFDKKRGDLSFRFLKRPRAPDVKS